MIPRDTAGVRKHFHLWRIACVSLLASLLLFCRCDKIPWQKQFEDRSSYCGFWDFDKIFLSQLSQEYRSEKKNQIWSSVWMSSLGPPECYPSKEFRTDMSVMRGLLVSSRTGVTAPGRSAVHLQAAPCVFIGLPWDTPHVTPLMWHSSYDIPLPL